MRMLASAALLALAAPLVAAPELPAEWLRPAADARGPLEKSDPRLLAGGRGASEEVDVLVALRLPEEARRIGVVSPRNGARRALLRRLGDDLEGEYGPFGLRVVRRFGEVPAFEARLPRSAVFALAGDPRVERVRPVVTVRALDAEGDALMKVSELRSAGLDGTGVTVAVVDSGVDYTHPELPLGTKVVNLHDAVDHDGDAMDGYGHGTPVAGIVAGLTTGVARGAKVAAVRVLDARGNGTDAQVLEGLDAVLASVAAGNPHGIRVVNFSLGGYLDETKPPAPGSCDTAAPDFKAAIDLLAQAGVLVVAASGNGGCTTGVVFPACVSGTLVVGAVYDAAVSPQAFGRGQCLPAGCSDAAPSADAIACYSDSGDRLDVLAPSHCAEAPRKGGGSYACFGGTSGAAPYASGVAALLFGADPARRPPEVKAAMRSTGTPVADPRNGVARNRLDAPAALAALRSAPQGTASAELLVPVVLDVTGVGGVVRFTSELTLTNRGTTPARLEATWVPATGMFPATGGGGTVTDALAPGEQRVIPDAIAWLRGAKGLAIPTGPGQAGTLRLVLTGLSQPGMASARVRTTGAACGGVAGLSYPAWSVPATSPERLRLFGLRSGAAERTNLALVNMGTTGNVTLKVVLRSGDGTREWTVPETLVPPLAPGEWRQVNDADLLRAAGFPEATALVSRVAGTAPFGAYAVFNDNLSNDGSFVPAVPDGSGAGGLVLPVVVETGAFESEVVVFNPSASPARVSLTYVESFASPKGPVGTATLDLAPGEQRILPSVLDRLRALGVPVGPRGATYAGTLAVHLRDASGTAVPGLAGAKTAAAGTGPCEGKGGFGLFYAAIPEGSGAVVEAFVDGLQQTATTRSNLALFNPSPTDPVAVTYEVHDGATGAVAFTSSPIELPARGWTQVDRVLLPSGVTEGFVRVRRSSAGGVFSAYGVLNDGAGPGERTGDGSYVEGAVHYPPD